MGIATAGETAPFRGAVFCLHQLIYTPGVPWIKVVMAGCGQLLICTCNSCLDNPHRPDESPIDLINAPPHPQARINT